jgi:single-stranded-DNA-specific exonuclease
LLLRYGGHDQAAGFSFLPENVSILREKLCELAEQWITEEVAQPSLRIDAEARLGDLTLPAVEELHLLEPTGEGNPQPMIAVRDLVLQDISTVGEGRNHLRLTLKEPEGPFVHAIWFRQAPMAEKLRTGQNVEICLSPMAASWNGRKTVEFRLEDVAVIEK